VLELGAVRHLAATVAVVGRGVLSHISITYLPGLDSCVRRH
jgi:hypothetical protein